MKTHQNGFGNRGALKIKLAVIFTAALGVLVFQVSRSQAALPSPLRWELAGWMGGGAYPMTVSDPNVAGRFYLLSDIGGLWKSDDRGDNWSYRTEGLTNINTAALAVSNSDSNVLYLGTEAGVYRSANAGVLWNFLSSTGTAKSFHRPESYRAIVVDRLDPNRVFIGTRSGEVFVSPDGGASWNRVGTATYPFGSSGAISVLYLTRDSSTLFAGAPGGLRKCDLASGAWTQAGISGNPVTDIASYQLNETIYVSYGKKIAWTADRGTTWQYSNDINANGVVYRFAVSSAPSGNTKFLVGWRENWNGGALLSEDGGASWVNIERNLNHDVQSDPTRVWTQGFGWPLSVGFEPDDSNAMFFTDFWGVWRSDDNGASWYEKIKGAPNAVGSDLVVSSDGSVLVGTMDNGLMMSSDEGLSYRNLVPNASLNGNSINGDVWRVVSSGARIIATNTPWNLNRSQVLVSNDGGLSFSVTSAGLPQTHPTGNTVWDKGYPRALALDPQNPNKVYLGIDGDSGGGLFISQDGGGTWARSSGQPGSLSIYNGLAVDPIETNRIYWAAIGANGGVYRSENGGQSWNRVLSAATWIFDVAVDKNGRVYAAADAGGPALYRSTDKGSTWSLLKKFPPTSGPCEAIAIDRNDPQRIAVSTIYWGGKVPGKIWLSEDGGLTWTDITGDLPNGAGAAAMAFSNDGAKLFASRYAGATYRIQLLNDTTAPTAPANLSATVAGATVNLSWTASTDNVAVSVYKISRDGAQVGTATIPGYTDTSVAAGTDYTYTVTAFDAANNSSPMSAALAVNVPLPADVTAPSVPSNLVSLFSSSDQVDLSWTGSTDDRGVTGYRIFRDGTSVGTSLGTGYTDTSAAPGTNYSYAVAAYDAAGNVSAMSTPLSVTVPLPPDTTPPTAPASLAAVFAGGNQVNLSWNASTDNVGIAKYTVYIGATALGDTTSTTYAHTAAQPGSTYVYTVKAVDGAGNVSSASNSVSLSIPNITSAPQNLTATVSSATRVDLRWEPPLPGTFSVYGYNIRRDGAYLKSVSTLSSFDSTASPGSHTYQIQAYTASNQLSGLSNAVTITLAATSTDTTAPSAPTLTAVLSGSAVNLTWTAATDNVGVAGYEVFRGSTSLTRSNALSYTDGSPVAGTSNIYTVKSYDAAGNVSSASNAVSITMSSSTTAPLNLIGTMGTDRVELRWQAPVAGTFSVYGYNIRRNGAYLKSVSTLSGWDNTAVVGSTNSYVVTAYNLAGVQSAPSNAVTVTFLPRPAVSNVVVSAVTTTTATVSWRVSIPAAGYVRYGTSATALSTQSYTVPASGTTAAVFLNGLQRNRTYYYQVVVSNSAGSSSSSVAQFRTAP